jgi:hypothetical protein
MTAIGTTRPCWPLASRSAYWGSAAFLSVQRVSAVQLPDLEPPERLSRNAGSHQLTPTR